jgi:1,4-dihydroxy-6-naphthoate synthase
MAGRVAVPGVHTTANLLLDLRAGRAVEKVPMVFHEIMPAVERGEVDAGVVIHEGRFTYRSHGLVALADLGQWWEGGTGLPIPLGGILLRRDMPELDPARIQRALRRSVEYGLAHPDAPMAYVRANAQELDDDVVRAHIGLYVNEFSADVGEEGRQAVEALLARAVEAGRAGCSDGALFPPEESRERPPALRAAQGQCRTSRIS